MRKIEELISLVEKEDISLSEFDFKGNLKGLYLDDAIFIDKNLNSREKKCILAEELGHHYTSYGNILDPTSINNIKQEQRARNWGIEILIELSDIIRASQEGVRNRFEFSEYLEVTEPYLEDALCYWRSKYGKSIIEAMPDGSRYLIDLDTLNVVKLKK